MRSSCPTDSTEWLKTSQKCSRGCSIPLESSSSGIISLRIEAKNRYREFASESANESELRRTRPESLSRQLEDEVRRQLEDQVRSLQKELDILVKPDKTAKQMERFKKFFFQMMIIS